MTHLLLLPCSKYHRKKISLDLNFAATATPCSTWCDMDSTHLSSVITFFIALVSASGVPGQRVTFCSQGPCLPFETRSTLRGSILMRGASQNTKETRVTCLIWHCRFRFFFYNLVNLQRQSRTRNWHEGCCKWHASWKASRVRLVVMHVAWFLIKHSNSNCPVIVVLLVVKPLHLSVFWLRYLHPCRQRVVQALNCFSFNKWLNGQCLHPCLWWMRLVGVRVQNESWLLNITWL